MKKISLLGAAALASFSLSNLAIAAPVSTSSASTGDMYAKLEGAFGIAMGSKYTIKEFTPSFGADSASYKSGAKSDDVSFEQMKDHSSKGFLVLGEFGANVTDEISVGLSAGYIQTTGQIEGFKGVTKALQGATLQKDAENKDVNIEGILATVQMHYSFLNSSNFTPYVLGGVGMSYGDLKASDKDTFVAAPMKAGKAQELGAAFDAATVDGAVIIAPTTNNDKMDKYTASLAWNVGVGATYKVNDMMGINVSYKFMDTGIKRELKSEEELIINDMNPADPTKVPAAGGAGTMKAPYIHAVTAGVVFSF